MIELGDLSRRNDELMAAKEADHNVIKDLDSQLKEYKRKYEQAKTDLRGLKGASFVFNHSFDSCTDRCISTATSQLFLPAPKSDDQWPISSEGGLVDIHVTAFVSAIDGLLTAGRSNAPTRVLTPMKAVVNAVTYIVEDVRTFERRPRRDRSEVDVEALRALRERAEATLSNLVVATKTHATSSGMSPVSLLDAAASHVSSTITEIAKTVHIRKATKQEQDQFEAPASSSTPSSANGFMSPRNGSISGSIVSPRRTGTMDSMMGLAPASPPNTSQGRRPMSNPSSSDGSASSPPPIFDLPPSTHTTGHTSEEQQPEDAWAELKVSDPRQGEPYELSKLILSFPLISPTSKPRLKALFMRFRACCRVYGVHSPRLH